MSSTTSLMRLVRAALAGSIVCAGAAIAAEQTRIEYGPTTLTPGVNNGQKGNWVTFTEYNYRYLTLSDRIAKLAKGKGLSEKQLAELLKELEALGAVPTDKAISDAIAKRLLSPEFKKAFIENHPYDGISSWSWSWGGGVNAHKGDRDWNMQELVNAFGSFGWKTGQTMYGWNGLQQASAPQTSRSLGQAYRFLKLAQEMQKKGLTSIQEPIVFSIQADDGVAWDYTARHYQNVSPSSHLSVLPNIKSEFFQGNTQFNHWTSVRRYTITDLTPQLAMQIAKDLYDVAIRCGSPIALDLNHDGRISVTGLSTAQRRKAKNAFVADGSVLFDLEAAGRKSRYEWLKGDEDGFLVNDRDGAVSQAVAKGGEVDGRILFGSAGGYENGYLKLAKFFDHGATLASSKGMAVPDGLVKGMELAGLKVWVDANHDAMVQASELKTLESLGITEIASGFKYQRSADDELLMRSHFVQNGKKQVTEDVWFAVEPADGE